MLIHQDRRDQAALVIVELQAHGIQSLLMSCQQGIDQRLGSCVRVKSFLDQEEVGLARRVEVGVLSFAAGMRTVA